MVVDEGDPARRRRTLKSTLHPTIFLGNGKIRRFGCSLLFSGVARVTHGGLHEAL